MNLDSHRNQQIAENARFLLGTGMHMDRVALRLGVATSTLRQILGRSDSGDRNPGASSQSSQGA